MFVHTVYFWLHDQVSRAQRDAFVAGVRALTTISSVRHGYVGIPAPTDRPIIDRSYSYALVVVFDDLAGHDRYQADPIHDRFRDTCGELWKKVVIYDSVTES
jgi:Stress responsive A/B Barrel Domain